MRRTLAGATVGLVLVASSAAQAQTVQPGMLVKVAGTQCTGGFIYDGAGALADRHYLGLAAHCVGDKIGARASDASGREFGTVAFSAWPYETYADDYSFVELDVSAYPRVDPTMAGHLGVPSGHVPARQGAPGDRLHFSGWGFLTASWQQTREQRPAVLKSHNDRFWYAEGIVSNTDSGGPVAHAPTGAALGSVSNYCVPLPLSQSEGFEPGCTGWGPSVAYILAAAAARGFPVEVRDAAEGPPKPKPPPPPPAAPYSIPPAPPPPAAKPRAKRKRSARCSKLKSKRQRARCKRRAGKRRR